MSLVIIAASFNQEIVGEMIKAASSELERQGKKVKIKEVTGCYEVPLAVDKCMSEADTEAVVVLGYIEKGETKHGEIMGHVVHKSLIDLQLKHSKPVGFGIIGPGATLEQAKVRSRPYAERAVKAALQNLSILHNEV